jgi:Fur family zinc uptake transcriptional regulator
VAKPRIRKTGQHDHGACIDHAVSTAAEVCAARGLNLTPVRLRVLQIVWRAHEPIGAYDILAELAKERDKAAPPTVYRALEFLMQAGLVHRIDSLNAFLGCDAPEHAHVAQFLVCRGCQRVVELDDPSLNRILAEKSRAAGFRIEPTSLEIKGLCSDCAARLSRSLPGTPAPADRARSARRSAAGTGS